MAHNAILGELAKDLVTSITGRQEDDVVLRKLQEHALRGFKDHSHARTNQFEIRDRLSGLTEKFAVLNREDLADGLQLRLDELPKKSKWLPELLSLLLELSDCPVEHTKLDVVERLSTPEIPLRELTWEDIIADDPLEDDGLWDDVDRGYHSSGDDALADDELGSEPTTSTLATSVEEEDLVALARLHVIQPDRAALDYVRAAREHMKGSKSSLDSSHLSELVLVRESLMMLHGLPTNVYHLNDKIGVVTKRDVELTTAAKSTAADVLEQIAGVGTQLNHLRRWCGIEQRAAYLQSVQASMQSLLSDVATQLGELERQFARPEKDKVVSIIDLRTNAEELARPLLFLSDIICRTDGSISDLPSSFALLDALYDEACIAQVSATGQVFAAIVQLLLAALRTYLKPVAQWTETGILPDRGGEDFFVQEANANCELGTIWHDRFALRKLDDGQFSAPAFIRPFLDKAFASGKARAFLRLLDPSTETPMSNEQGAAVDGLDLSTLQLQMQMNPLLPFQQLLDNALRRRMLETGLDCTCLVRNQMLHDHGLIKTLTSLDYVFFAKDGSLFQLFAESLFERIDRSRAFWKDRFMLTELAQHTLGSAPGVDADSVVMRTDDERDKDMARPVLRELERVELQYILPWPVQNIIRPATLTTHSAAFVFLLQTYYARSLLRSELFTLRTLNSKTADLPPHVAAMLKLRWRLTSFAEILHSHITDTACALHQTMEAGMQAADGIDGMASVWAEYEKRLPIVLLLAPSLRPIQDTIVSVLELCERSTQAWKQLMPAQEHTSSQSSLSSVTKAQSGTVDPLLLLEELERSLSFIKAGLRSVSRAGGETTLESLAERLEWHGS